MMTATTQHEESTAGAADQLLMAIELGRRQWHVGFTTRLGHRIRRRTLPADAWDRLPEEIAAAKKRLACRCVGHELLRGGTGRVLDSPVSHRRRC